MGSLVVVATWAGRRRAYRSCGTAGRRPIRRSRVWMKRSALPLSGMMTAVPDDLRSRI